MAGQNNYNKMAYNGAQPGPIMNQPLSAYQIQHQVNAQRHRKPNSYGETRYAGNIGNNRDQV